MRIPFTNIEIRAKKRAPRPDAWSDFWYTREGYDSSTGLTVSEDSSLTHDAVYACVRVISEDIASLPLFVYQRVGNGKEKAENHPLYTLLHDAPNDEMSAMQFRECLQAHLLTWGNAYAQIQRDMRGWPIALWPLNPGQMTVTRPEKEIEYEYRISETGETIYFAREEIFHVAGLGYNGLIGYSPISYAREAIAVGLSAQDWQATNFANGGRMQIAFCHPAPIAPKPEGRQQLKKDIRAEYGGRGGEAIGVLWEGMKPEKIGMTMEDAEFIASRKLNVIQIARIFRVPPHKIMDLERATFSNIEESNIDYVVSTLRPWCVRWEQAINQQLLMQSGQYIAEHRIDALMRGNIQNRYNAYAVGRNWGWLSINDIRALENLNPIPNGDDYLQPLNMGIAGQPAASAEPVTDDEAQAAARAIRQLRVIRGQ